ncbi:SemiSWEET transporter [Candidatus Woesearchaeota archaeon]|nr:SemiSWEET transporter [Candidatus Woesearchaeota archaeon]
MDYTTIIGSIAATLTTIAFIPQLIKTWKTKSARDISLGMFLIFCAGVFLWLIYGVLKKDAVIVIANFIVFVLSFIIFILKIRYK